ncbi:unannotated protein [freshwater metagenome]|uniref:Unannotated protein n=1 Tax=freshwater metagenome TaxID=449393 RepID=A0A6J7L2N1_9ZZZZ|nr:hypothetical protein [Actinomycetota bacterium]
MAVKKKKVEEVKAPPIISKLPISISDSPLVIDLPDGQKLVVGRMVQGSVIEVATWRGTGRPDSRTSRLMLGMSIDGVNQSPEQKAAEEAANAADAPAQRASQFSNPALARAQEILWAITGHPLFKKLFGKPGEKKARTPKAQAPVPAAPVTPATPAPTAAVPTPAIASIAAEPVSPFTTPASRGKKPSRSIKLFGSKKVKSAKTPVPSKPIAPSSSESADIDAWLDEISSKAKARVENKSAKPAPAKKTVKKAAPVAKKRK